MSSHVEHRLASWFSAPASGESLDELVAIIKPLLNTLEPVWHPLGFVHAKVVELPSQDTFRLHLWPSNQRHAAEQEHKVHDHLFNVFSRVVYGNVTNVKYDFCPDIAGAWREIRVHYGGAQVKLVETGRLGNLIELDSSLYAAPSTYEVPCHELHETILSGESDALTVVRTSAHSHYSPRAIFQKGAALPSPRSPVPYDKKKWLKLLEKMIPI